MNPKKDSNPNLAVSAALRYLFEKSGKTLSDVSDRVGVTPSNLSRTHNFERVPTYVEVLLLCDFYSYPSQKFEELVRNISNSQLLEDLKEMYSLKRKTSRINTGIENIVEEIMKPQ
jgi:transcriptional regulator with XRE-family HTH domain